MRVSELASDNVDMVELIQLGANERCTTEGVDESERACERRRGSAARAPRKF